MCMCTLSHLLLLVTAYSFHMGLMIDSVERVALSSEEGWLNRAMVLCNFQCWDVLLICILVEQGLAGLAVGTRWELEFLDSTVLSLHFLFTFFWEMAWYRLKYCHKGPLNENNQPTTFSEILQKKDIRNKTKSVLYNQFNNTTFKLSFTRYKRWLETETLYA